MTWFRRLSSLRRRPLAGRPRPRGARPALETLEDRCVLANGLNVNQAYVQNIYMAVLGRPASDTEQSQKEQSLVANGLAAGVALPTELSPESAGRIVTDWYRTFLGRTPQNGEEAPYVANLLQGGTEEDTLAVILSSDEYYFVAAPRLLNEIPSDATFVRALYRQLLNRDANPDELQLFPPPVDRVRVPLGFLRSPEYRTRVVGSFYPNLLDRPAFTDQEVAGWVNSPLDLRSIRLAFETSQEFFDLGCPDGICSPVSGLTEAGIPASAAAGSNPQIATGADGNLWFTEPTNGRVARLRTGVQADGTVVTELTEFALPVIQVFNGTPIRGTPTDITPGPDGAMWFTVPDVNRVGRVGLDGTVTSDRVPTGNAAPTSIVAGPDGAMWFTELNTNRLGRVTLGGDFSEFPIPTANSGPTGITVGADRALWFTEANANRIGRLGLDKVFSEFALPTAGAGPRDITAGPDGALWFTEAGVNAVGRISTSGVPTNEFPAGSLAPDQIITAADGNLWFTRTDGSVGRLTPRGGLTVFTAPTSGAQIGGLAAGPDGNVWFTENGAARVAVALNVPDPDRTFIVQQYRTFLARLPSAAEIHFWQNEFFLHGIGPVRVAIAASPEAQARPIQLLYAEELRRPANDAEVAFWQGQLRARGRTAVASGIETSPEARTQLVRSWYSIYLDRVPLFGEEQPFVSQLLSGVPEAKVLSNLLGSAEYINRAPIILGQGGASSPPAYVTALFQQLLGRAPSAPELQARLTQLETQSPVAVAQDLLFSAEYRRRVTTGYYGSILLRMLPPTAPEVENWVKGPPDLLLVRIGLESSNEFFARGQG
jgi:virginiamycin B lyase